MRGEDRKSEQLFSYVSVDRKVHEKHPLRLIREVVNDALKEMTAEFEELYASEGRPSIAPEKLLRALLLQAFYGIRSERQLMEQLEYNTLYKWFVGLDPDEGAWDASTFSKNRDRLLEAEVSQKLLAAIVRHPRVKRLMSKEHFSVDGTLIAAYASMKSFRRKDDDDDAPPPGRNAERDFHGEKLSNATHESRTDADARLYRKGQGKESRLCHMGHALMENRNGLAVCGMATPATGTAEREAAQELIDRHRKNNRRITLGADKAYDVADFVRDLKQNNVTPHIAVDGHLTKTGKTRKTAIDRRTLRHAGYAVSQRIRKRIEEIFGWLKTAGGMTKTFFRGTARVNAAFNLGLCAYNLMRLPKLLAAPS